MVELQVVMYILGLSCWKYISLLTKGKWLSTFYRSFCSTYKSLWTKSKLLCTIYKSLCLKNMSLWAKDKSLSITYRSLFSNYRLVLTKSKLLCTLYKSLYLNNMSLWAKDACILQIVILQTISCSGLKASCCAQFTGRYAWKICRYGQKTSRWV